MIQIDNVLVSDDIKEKFFVCDLDKCKGACCVEGDLGAPLLEEELDVLENVLDEVKPYLMPEGVKAIEEQGAFVNDWQGEYSTPTIRDAECAYAYYDQEKVLKCGIEKAYRDGKIDFYKPLSCHMYPIRVLRLKEMTALNYDVWDICNPACSLGSKLGVPIYKFLKEPLIRFLGQDWYDKLCKEWD